MLHAIWLGEITIRHRQVRARFTEFTLEQRKIELETLPRIWISSSTLGQFECIDQGRSGLVLL